jgi:hypothetical protein
LLHGESIVDEMRVPDHSNHWSHEILHLLLAANLEEASSLR